MLSVPLALIGALMALFVTGWSITMGAMIGLILLMGLVTKNAILLVDQALQNLRAGDELDEALIKAGPRRLRPILMTSAAMAIGMVPTALGRGQGFEFRAPMAIAVIGGYHLDVLDALRGAAGVRGVRKADARGLSHQGPAHGPGAAN
jgi:HAE1 family hydrophobic/amphiphilic exporter-1